MTGDSEAPSLDGNEQLSTEERLDTVRVLESGRPLRIRTFDCIEGLFAATTTGLYHTPDGDHWTDLVVPQDEVYAVVADPAGRRLYAGTRPAHVYVVDLDGCLPSSGALDWRDVDSFRRLAAHDDWGIDRHDGIAQVRALQVPDDAPDRLVAGVEVGGVYVSDDQGATWQDRRISGFDAPHTDDIHHLAIENSETIVAATGSGLYRTTDTGRTWCRLDSGRRQSYFREPCVQDGTLYAGGSPTSPRYWTEDRDHALFKSRDGQPLEPVSTPTPNEVVVGWCTSEGTLVAVTNQGSLLQQPSDGWVERGVIPVPESVHGRCIPLCWYEP